MEAHAYDLLARCIRDNVLLAEVFLRALCCCSVHISVLLGRDVDGHYELVLFWSYCFSFPCEHPFTWKVSE